MCIFDEWHKMKGLILRTQRLTLRMLTHDDAPFIIQLLNSEGWLKFIGDKNVHTIDQAIHYLEQGPLKSYAENGFGLSLVERNSDGVAIGVCGLLKRNFLDSPDIGFAFLPEFSGQGYALEIAEATLTHATTSLNQQTILAVVMPANHRSVRLLEKIGMTFEKTITFPSDSEELLLYRWKSNLT
jgi:RimJ/RimL family protein N-acetyltransferase